MMRFARRGAVPHLPGSKLKGLRKTSTQMVSLMPQQTRHERITAAVREVILRWDPYGLLACGAPLDEFDTEIAVVAQRAGEIHSIDDATKLLSSVFSATFGPEDFQSIDCAAAGTDLY
jgi:hypothetical protein